MVCVSGASGRLRQPRSNQPLGCWWESAQRTLRAAASAYAASPEARAASMSPHATCVSYAFSPGSANGVGKRRQQPSSSSVSASQRAARCIGSS
jgi:hypothetical protein